MAGSRRAQLSPAEGACPSVAPRQTRPDTFSSAANAAFFPSPPASLQQDDAQMLTASGDQTISLWDTGHADLLASFRGHSGSVKTVCPMPAAPAVFASGMECLWDGGDGGPAGQGVVGQDLPHGGLLWRHQAGLLGPRPGLPAHQHCRSLPLSFTGARDGALMVWDARVPARTDGTTGEPFHSPVVTVQACWECVVGGRVGWACW